MTKPITEDIYNEFNSTEFNNDQMKEIYLYLQSSIGKYADLKFDIQQMIQIRIGIKNGVDVSQYADPKFDWIQMREIRSGLESGVDITQYADPKFKWTQMLRIRNQMLRIRKGIENETDIN